MQAVFEKHVQASLAVVPSKLRLVLQLMGGWTKQDAHYFYILWHDHC